MHRRIAAALAAALVMGLLSPLGGRARAADDIAALTTKDNGCQYYLMVDRAQHVVTVYGLDEDGYYTVPVKAMVCSVGKPGDETPLGTYSTTSFRAVWCYMVDGSYGQYATQFYGGYMFHSVCYYRNEPNTLMTYEYNDLGKSVSRGCVRLQVNDAKWVYEQCPPGTLVTVFDGTEPGPLEPPGTLLGYIDPGDPKAGWDPTDPREENPWHSWLEEHALPFEDVTFGAECFDDVAYVWANGLMEEREAGQFQPEAPLTWGEARRAAGRLVGGPTLEPGLCHLPQLLALRKGQDHADDEPITRGQLAELVKGCALAEGREQAGTAMDGDPEEWLTRAQGAGWLRAYHRRNSRRES